MPPSRTLWLVLVVALLVRASLLTAVPDAFSADPDGYRRLAENVWEHGVLGDGRVPTAYRPPAYPLLLVPCAAFGPGTRIAIGAVHVLLGAATVGLTFLLVRQAGMSNVPACLAAGLVTIDPILLAQSALVMSETLAALLVVVVVYLLERCTHRPALGKAALAGAAIGLLALCRPGLLTFALPTLVLLTWLNGQTADVPSTKRWTGTWRTPLAVLAGLAVIVGPWVIRNQFVFGRPMVTTTHGGYTLLLGNNPFYYEHLRKGRWFQAWRAEAFHAWWRRELMMNGLLDKNSLSTPSHGTKATQADTPAAHGSGTGMAPLLNGAPRRTANPRPLVFRSPQTELRADALAYHHARIAIRRQPGIFAWSCLVRVGRFWSPLPFRLSSGENAWRRVGRWIVAVWYALEFGLAAVGMCLVLFRPHARRNMFLWALLLALALTAVHTFYWSNLRMRAPLAPLIAMAAAEGVVGLWRRTVQPANDHLGLEHSLHP